MSLLNFPVATLPGSIPMTFICRRFGSVLKVSTTTALIPGLAIVASLGEKAAPARRPQRREPLRPA
jgi:uncharacterized membrane protein YdjX (TVP38/TMEM64 family)